MENKSPLSRQLPTNATQTLQPAQRRTHTPPQWLTPKAKSELETVMVGDLNPKLQEPARKLRDAGEVPDKQAATELVSFFLAKSLRDLAKELANLANVDQLIVEPTIDADSLQWMRDGCSSLKSLVVQQLRPQYVQPDGLAQFLATDTSLVNLNLNFLSDKGGYQALLKALLDSGVKHLAIPTAACAMPFATQDFMNCISTAACWLIRRRRCPT